MFGEDKFRYNLPTDLTEYANKRFETYVNKADVKQEILIENPEPDNLDQVKKLDNFVRDILKDKQKEKDFLIDVIFDKTQSSNACLMDPKSRYPLIRIILKYILRKQYSCWARPVITSHIFEGITFLEGGGRKRRQICYSCLTENYSIWQKV